MREHYFFGARGKWWARLIITAILTAMVVMALSGCNGEAAAPTAEPFQFVCRKDGVETLRVQARHARMQYDTDTQIERWRLDGVVGVYGRELYHESDPGEVCNPQVQPANVD